MSDCYLRPYPPGWGFIQICDPSNKYSFSFINAIYVQAIKEEITIDGQRLIHVYVGDSWFILDLPDNTDYTTFMYQYFPVFAIPRRNPE